MVYPKQIKTSLSYLDWIDLYGQLDDFNAFSPSSKGFVDKKIVETPEVVRPSPQDETACLTYLEWQELYEHEKPFQIFSAVPESAEDQRTDNLVFKNGEPETMHDIRGNESRFTLNQNGFAICRHVTKMVDFSDEEAIKTIYLPEIEAMIKDKVDGVDQVHVFDYRIRKNKPINKDRVNVADKMQHLLPAQHAHCDQSPAGALGRLRRHCPSEADYLLQGRMRIINVWRPIHHTVTDHPLALCDSRTVGYEDLVEADHITRQYAGKAMYGMYDTRHKWYYLNRQSPEEVTFIKIFDSDPDVEAHFCMHAAFRHTNVSANSLPRESIEIRTLVFTYPQDSKPD
ncbi:hypothetical protein MMC30_003432 [Trapelia coarctata]|nr:hypothetical protein [Trapelia coarctata]